jgi:hypothetical protein
MSTNHRDTRGRDSASRQPDGAAKHRVESNGRSLTGILDERIQNLREAIHEIDEALAGRKKLNVRFLEQIDREYQEARYYLNLLQEPWKAGYEPQIEFLRLSLHKSLTSRAKDRRAEELKCWENHVNLAKERRIGGAWSPLADLAAWRAKGGARIVGNERRVFVEMSGPAWLKGYMSMTRGRGGPDIVKEIEAVSLRERDEMADLLGRHLREGGVMI